MTRSAYITLGGGIDLVTPPRQLKPGACLYAINYECPVTGGYRRIDGYTQLGLEVPGEGRLLGVVSFADEVLAVREQPARAPSEEGGEPRRWAAIFALEGAGSSASWRFIAEAHPGRHEWVEGNVEGTEGGRTLYGVGEGLPFGIQLPADVAGDYTTVPELSEALVGQLPAGVGFSATGDTITVTDTEGRDITGVEVLGRDGSTLLAVADAAGDGSTNTTLDIDLAGITPNDVAHITLAVGTGNLPRRLSAPDQALRFIELSAAPTGARFIALHSNHLFLGFEPGSVQHSDLGDPAGWDAATGGAGEIAVGQELTGLLNGTGGVLHILCRDSVLTLYGTSAADWQLKTTVPNSGARPYSAQSLIQPYFVAERGITSLDATQQYGDFRPMQPGASVEPLFTEDGLTNRIVASSISKSRAQYRIWFDNGTGMYMSPTGISTVEFPDQVAVASSGELDSGEEMMLFGDDKGFVYRLGSGDTSFNGKPIQAFLTLAYTDLKQPTIRKRFRRVFWDIRSGSNATITVQPDFDYGRVETARHIRQTLTFILGGGLWNVDNWDEFTWSVPSLAQQPADVAGSGTAINFAIYSNSISEPHEVLGYDLVYDMRRQRRG